MKDYLKDNTQVREDILNLKLFYELKEASAKRGIHLKTFKSDVDVNGFDIILDNNDDILLKCQVKSRFDAKTAYFDIHPIMLKPSYYLFDSFEFPEPMGCPQDIRGVILIDATLEDEKIQTRYYYLDIFLLRALELGIFQHTKKSKDMASGLMSNLRTDSKYVNEKVKVLQTLFFPVKNIDALLAIMGFHSIYDRGLSYNILSISKIISGTSGLSFESEQEKIGAVKGHWEAVNEGLAELVHEDGKFKSLTIPDDYFASSTS